MKVSTSFLCNEKPEVVIEKLNNSNTDYIHFDVMDGKFVKNKFLNLKEFEQALQLCQKPKDIHLMVENGKKYIDIAAKYNPEYITIHYETENFLDGLEYINNKKIKAGLAISPSTKIKEIYPYLDLVDQVLVMSVNPGASGQKFINKTKYKVNRLKHYIKKYNLNTIISVDGGIRYEVLNKVKNADILVSSSYVLEDLENINKIKTKFK